VASAFSSGVATSTVHVSLGVTLGNGLALVVEFSTLGQAQFHLGSTVFEVELEWDESDGLAVELNPHVTDLSSMRQELAATIGIVGSESMGEAPLGDVDADQPELAGFNSGEGVSQLRLALTEGLHLRALEDDAALVGLQYVVVVASPTVGRDDAVT